VSTKDPLYKVRRFLEMLQANWQKFYTLNKNICLDEKMIAFTAKSSMLQYIKNKPTR
jgi:hypothetical protein